MRTGITDMTFIKEDDITHAQTIADNIVTSHDFERPST
jgi:hypothetical protein